MSFTIAMPNVFDSLVNRTWMSATYRDMVKRQNPYSDPIIAELQLLKFNLQRSIAMYDDESKHIYWRFLAREDQIEREAMLDFYESRYIDVCEAEQAAFAKWIDQEAFRFQPNNPLRVPELKRGIPDEYTPHDYLRGSTRLDLMHRLVMPGLPNTYIDSLIRPGYHDEMKPILAKPVQMPLIKLLRRWRQYSWIQDIAMTSSHILSYDFASKHQHLNELKGQSAQSHLLAVNQNIPLPNHATWFGWAQQAVMQFSEVSSDSIFERMCGFRPRALLTYTLPCMPWTKEHASGSLIRSEDTHADHSLPAKSVGHARDEHDRIQYGQWRVRSVLLGNSPDCIHVVADENLKQHVPMIACIYRHIDMLPARVRPSMKLLYPMPADLMYQLRIPMWDPFQAVNTPAEASWPFKSVNTTDTPWRSLSKFSHVHLRFDESESGRKYSQVWIDAFEAGAIRWLDSTSQSINESLFRAIKSMTYDKQPIQSKKGAAKWDMNLDSFKS